MKNLIIKALPNILLCVAFIAISSLGVCVLIVNGYSLQGVAAIIVTTCLAAHNFSEARKVFKNA